MFYLSLAELDFLPFVGTCCHIGCISCIDFFSFFFFTITIIVLRVQTYILNKNYCNLLTLAMNFNRLYALQATMQQWVSKIANTKYRKYKTELQCRITWVVDSGSALLTAYTALYVHNAQYCYYWHYVSDLFLNTLYMV